MSKSSRRSTRSRRAAPSGRGRSADPHRRTRLLAGVGVIAALAVAAIAFSIVRSGGSSAVAWSRFGTGDVHSLAFVGDDPNRLLFGHHGGLLSSADRGRSWQPLSTRSDAMSLGAATEGSIVIAGHDVLAESRDDGRTWQDIPAALQSRDIHGFAQDPGDPARMWAYLATGGLWQSRDGGLAWERVQEENVLFPVAITTPSGTRLFGVTASGLGSSDDGGRTWRNMANPELNPVASLAATSDGLALVAGGPEGLARSDNGGASWSKLAFQGQVFAIAVASGGQTIAVVTRSTEFFRSDDGGQTWPGP